MDSILTRFPMLAEALEELIERYGFDAVVDAVDELREEAEGT